MGRRWVALMLMASGLAGCATDQLITGSIPNSEEAA
jgi:type IV pilus biogenesis protein CpaD/CtpE